MNLQTYGYRRYIDYLERIAYQKKILDEDSRVKYFITIRLYYHNEIILYEVELQFTKDGDTYDVTLHHNKSNTVQDIERKVEELWIAGNFDYYG